MKKIFLALVAFGFAGAAYANDTVDLSSADSIAARPDRPDRPGQPGNPGGPGYGDDDDYGQPGRPGGPGWGNPGNGGPGWGGPGWGRPPMRQKVECLARNIRGQGFVARGNNVERAAEKAIMQCRYQTGFPFARSCRVQACRRVRF